MGLSALHHLQRAVVSGVGLMLVKRTGQPDTFPDCDPNKGGFSATKDMSS